MKAHDSVHKYDYSATNPFSEKKIRYSQKAGKSVAPDILYKNSDKN